MIFRQLREIKCKKCHLMVLEQKYDNSLLLSELELLISSLITNISTPSFPLVTTYRNSSKNSAVDFMLLPIYTST